MSPLSATGPSNWLDAAQFTTGPTSDTPKSSNIDDPSKTKEIFLQLLVAQMKNQNPLNPADGAEYLAQLSQITGVEQMLEMRKQLEGIHGVLAAATTAPAGSNQP